MNRVLIASVGVAALMVGIVFAWYSVRQEREFQRLVAAGDAALAGDRTYVAIEAFSGALAFKPDSMLAYLKRGDTYRRRGELDAALRDLTRAAALDPSAPRPLELLGDVNAALGHHDQAAEHYLAFNQLDDSSPRVQYKLALAYYRHGRAGMGIEPLRLATTLDDGLVEAHYLLGLCLRATGREGDAQETLARALDLDPAFTAAREELADLHAAAGRHREAIEQLEALAALEPTRPERLVSVGLAYARMGRIDAAVLTLGRAAERFPDAQVVYTALGRVWLESAELRNDEVALVKALEALQPRALAGTGSSETLMLYGRGLLLAGDVAGAERALRQAATRRPVIPATFRYLADAAERLGHTVAAEEARLQYAALTR